MRLYFVFPFLVLRILSSSQYGVQIARTTPSLYSAVYRSFSTLSNKNNTSFSKFDELKADMKCRYLIAKDALQQCDNKDKVLFSAFTLSPVGWVVGGLSAITGLGLPWWGSIVALTFGLRCLLFPLQIKQMKAQSKMVEIQPKLNALMDKMKIASLNGETDLTSYQLETRNLYKSAGLSPFSLAVSSFVQLPVLLCLFWGVERCVKTIPDLATGGFLWFSNLTLPDPYYILPIVANSFLFLSTSTMSGPNASNMKNLSRAMIVFSFLVTLKLNSAMVLLLLSTSFFQVTTDLMLKSKPIRRLLDVPDLDKSTHTTMFDIKDIPPPPTTPYPKHIKQINEEMNHTIQNILNNETTNKNDQQLKH